MIEFKKEYITQIWKNVKKKLTASNITFSDGDTFQDKYDNGELKGEKGDKGTNGTNGKDGAKGADGTSITSVTQTTTSSADGGINEVTVSLSNGTSSKFQFKNGSKGSAGTNGTNGTNGKDGKGIRSTEITYSSSASGTSAPSSWGETIPTPTLKASRIIIS